MKTQANRINQSRPRAAGYKKLTWQLDATGAVQIVCAREQDRSREGGRERERDTGSCGRRAKAILAVAENAKNYILPLLQTKDETESLTERETERGRESEREHVARGVYAILLAGLKSLSEARCRR